MAIDGNYDGEITLKNGMGITQGIRDELGLTKEDCKKMNRSVWTEILDCVVEQNNQNPIYKGGSDINGLNTRNFMVYHGDVIKFSKDIWNKIVQIVNNALGKNIEKLETTSPENEVEGESDSVAVDESETTSPENEEVAVSDLEAVDEPELRLEDESADIPEADAENFSNMSEEQDSNVPEQEVSNSPEIRDSTMPAENLEDIKRLREGLINKQNTRRAGKKIHGLRYRTYIYDKSGHVTQVIRDKDGFELNVNRDSTGKIIGYNEKYSENGHLLTNIIRDSNGDLRLYTDYKYNGDGNLIRSIERGSTGELQSYTDYEYNSDGNLIRSTERGSAGRLHSYTDYEYDSDGKLQGYTKYSYDESGNLAETTEYYSDGYIKPCAVDQNPPVAATKIPTDITDIPEPDPCSILGKHEKLDNNLTRDIHYDSNGQVILFIITEQEDNNHTRDVYYDPNGQVTLFIITEQEDNNHTRVVFYNPNGQVQFYEQREYDEDGNVIREIERDNKGRLIVVRENPNTDSEIERKEN